MNRQRELRIERLLGIHTRGDDESRADKFHSAYQPTPYEVLELLASSGYIGKDDHLIDYGCGKGRVSIYLSRMVGCRSTGIEYDERIYAAAMQNLSADSRVRFIHACAESFDVPADADRFYFFNPFSAEILKAVTARILDSYYGSPRKMVLFAYYPMPEYTDHLDRIFERIGEIDCRALFDRNDDKERILIYGLN